MNILFLNQVVSDFRADWANISQKKKITLYSTFFEISFDIGFFWTCFISQHVCPYMNNLTQVKQTNQKVVYL